MTQSITTVETVRMPIGDDVGTDAAAICSALTAAAGRAFALVEGDQRITAVNVYLDGAEGWDGTNIVRTASIELVSQLT